MTSMALSLDSVIVAAPDQVSCDLGGDAAILHLGSGIYYGLDPVGAFIWSRLHRPQTVAQLRDAVVAEFDVAAERCQADIFNLLDRLAAEKLIEVRSRA
jgi:hypothetical protein